MIKVEINPEDGIDSFTYVDKKTGQQVRKFKQMCWFYLGGRHPQKGNFEIKNEQSSYPAGEYELDISSFRIGKFGSLEVDSFNTKLIPVGQSSNQPTKLEKAS